MGFLTGTVFAFFYTVAGVPLARLADRQQSRPADEREHRAVERIDRRLGSGAQLRAARAGADRRRNRRGHDHALHAFDGGGLLSAASSGRARSRCSRSARIWGSCSACRSAAVIAERLRLARRLSRGGASGARDRRAARAHGARAGTRSVRGVDVPRADAASRSARCCGTCGRGARSAGSRSALRCRRCTATRSSAGVRRSSAACTDSGRREIGRPSGS